MVMTGYEVVGHFL